MKKIYFDFNDWYSQGKHGCSSASKGWLKEIWDDLEPTMRAGKRGIIQEAIKRIEEKDEMLKKEIIAKIDYNTARPDKSFFKYWLQNIDEINQKFKKILKDTEK